MRNHISRLVVVGVVALTAAGVAGVAVGAQNHDGTQRAAKGVASGPATPAATHAPAKNPDVEHESGIVLEGVGEIRGTSFMVTVYENSRYGNSIQVVLGDPDDNRIGYVEQAEPFVVDGVLDASVTVDGKVVTIRGSVVPTGQPQKVVDSQTDAGQRIITKGTQRALATDVTLSLGSAVAEIGFAPAFAFDLQTRRVQLYGN